MRSAILLGLGHLVDEAVVHPLPGVQLRGAPSSLLGILSICLLVVILWPLMRTTARAATAAGLGSAFAALGGVHVLHAVTDEPTRADVTGWAAALGGLALLVCAIVATVQAARPRRPHHLRGWVRTAGIATAALVVAVFGLVPLAVGTSMVHMPARPLAAPPGPGFSPISLRTDDGLTLQAWYRPSRNGAAVMILNSSRGDHAGSSRHAALLAAHGYGVLVYDARGTGGSQGRPNGWGWTWAPDVASGVDYLAARPDVDAAHIGLLGLSTGADVALAYAAQDPRIRVVVADGATAASFADRPGSFLDAVSLWPMFTAGQLLSGDRPSRPLTEAVGRISPRPVLLVAAGSIPVEIPLNREYAAAGGGSVTLWTLPDVAHTAAITQRPQEYAARVLATLAGALS